MESRIHLRTLVLIFIISPILAGCHLKIPLEIGGTDEQLEKDIQSFVNALHGIIRHTKSNSIVAYSGNFDLRPSLEQRLMERLSVPIYTVESNIAPLNQRYQGGHILVVVLFTGLDDPILAALNDTGLAYGLQVFAFFSPKLLDMDEKRQFFNWSWERKFIISVLCFQGEFEFEMWSYYYLKDLTLSRIDGGESLKNIVRSHGYRFLVQVANDIPTIFWYNSSDQADVIGGGNISLSGPIGLLVVEFMRNINASMDILPIPESQNSNYEIIEGASNRRVDMVANLVVNDSLIFSPVVMDTKTCLLLPHRRRVPLNRYMDKLIDPSVHLLTLAASVCVFGVKYIAHRRRSLVNSFFNTFRFFLAVPLPGGQLERLPLADKIVEVYAFLWVGIFISTGLSLLSSVLTTGIYYPPITDVESMRASGLRIITSDPTIQEAFRTNQLPSSLADLLDFVDENTTNRNFLELNDSLANVVRTPNWWGLRLYQDRLRTKVFSIAGPKLCSSTRYLRLPISPHSPLRFMFKDYLARIVESGIGQKWLVMGFRKFREVFGITKLPFDSENEWKPLTLSYYTVFIRIYIGGMLLSTLVFIVELLYKRYHG